MAKSESITFNIEVLDEPLANEIEEISQLHSDEVDLLGRDLNIRWDLLFQMQQAGGLVLLTARRLDKLVGYAAYMLAPNPIYSNEIHASMVAIFILKECRAGKTGPKFFLFCEKMVIQFGATVIQNTYSTKNEIGPLLSKLGYTKTDITMSKRLNHV